MLAVLWQLPILKILLRLKFFVDIPLNSIEYNIHCNFKLKKLSIDLILFYIFLGIAKSIIDITKVETTSSNFTSFNRSQQSVYLYIWFWKMNCGTVWCCCACRSGHSLGSRYPVSILLLQQSRGIDRKLTTKSMRTQELGIKIRDRDGLLRVQGQCFQRDQ